jgi:hypothetical protein
MNDRMLVLSRSLRRDVKEIESLYDALGRYTLHPESDAETLIVIAYYLHNLYSAFENVFEAIAAAFENSVEDMGRWHIQLLERMRLDVMPLRPAVIDDEAFEALDELRRFRHLFRHAYSVRIDPLRLQLVLQKALRLRVIYPGQLEAFLAFVAAL